MQHTSFMHLTGDLSNFDQQVLALEDQRTYPPEDALAQFGTVVMNELLDLTMSTALEDHQQILAETLIGAFHSAIQRIEREADRSRDQLNILNRDFDGSEIADTEMQDALHKTRSLDVAVMAIEFVRDSASATYTAATGDVWTPWKGNVRASRTTAAQIMARDALRASRAAKHAAVTPGKTVVAFRGSPKADTAADANRIYDALNWALKEYPDMALATTGAPGAEKLALKWAKQKNVTVVMAAVDFNNHGKSAPFKANDQMLDLEPTLCITLDHSLDEGRAAQTSPFGPALNLGQKAATQGLRHIRILQRA